MNRRRHFSSLTLLLILGMVAGCAGAPRTTVMGTDEVTSILLVGDLLGGTVQLSNGFSRTIGEDDLQKSITSMHTVKDSPDQKMDQVLLNVDPGEMELSFTRRDGKVFDRRLYVSPGITNKVRLQ